jgi:Asp-tRNA(Asn)/Glu-tRNA(Gln) amidotransferase A subunit family amidase
VPVAVKDEIDQAPYPTYVGTTFLAKNPAQDCTPVARLRAAGALLIGKANMNELGLDPCGFNAHYGTTRNPYNPAHDPGGSSSGPGAATATGLCPIAVGCDGGGSIRIPASLCGIVGLKPTFGRISEAGAPPLCPSVDVIGPLGASVEDVTLAYGLMAGPDPRDPRSQYQPPVSLAGWNHSDLHGLTLGVYLAWFRHAAAGVVAACEAMLAQLEQAGAQVREIEVPGLDAMRVAHVVTILSEQAANMSDHREQIGQLGAPTRVTLALTHAFTAVDYVQAQRIRTRAIAAFERVFESVDAILTPSTAITAPPIPPGGESGGWSDLSVTTEKMRYAFPANLTGLPAISFPAGYDENGLPVGMQAMGRYWQEHLLLRIAFAAEQMVRRQAPQVFFPILAVKSIG